MNNSTFPLKWRALIGLSLLSFTAFLDFTIVSTAIPFIQKSLHASILQLQWVNNIFALVLSMFMIAAGYFGDRFGRRRIYYLGFVFFIIAAIGAALSQSIEWLIFFRAVQGFAAAIIFTIGVALLPQAFPADEQNRAIGIFSAITGVGLAIGPFLGGLLISLLSWRWVFWINVPIIVIGLVMCAFSLQAPPKGNTQARMDWSGFVLLIIGVGSLIYGLIHGEQIGWQLMSTWCYIIIGIAGIVVLLIVESRLEHPMLELSVLKNPLTRLATLCACAAGLVTFVLFFFDPLFLKITRSETAFMIGLLLFATPVVQVILSLQLSRLIKTFGLVGLFLIALIASLFSSILHSFLGSTSPVWFIVLAFALMGITWGVANSGVIAAVSSSIDPTKIGSGIGTVFTLWNVAGSIFLALGAALFNNSQKHKMAQLVSQQHTPLNPSQHQFIGTMLKDPSNAYEATQAYHGPHAQTFYQSFQNAFLHGFHTVTWAVVIVTALMVVIGFTFARRCKNSNG